MLNGISLKDDFALAFIANMCSMKMLIFPLGPALKSTSFRSTIWVMVSFTIAFIGYSQTSPKQTTENNHTLIAEQTDLIGHLPSLERAKQLLVDGMPEEAFNNLKLAEEADRFDPEVQFYLGEVWTERAAHSKAREKFKIALRLDPESFTPAFRLAQIAIALWKQTREEHFRTEAVGYLWRIKSRWNTANTDRYTQDEVASAAIILQTEKLMRTLLDISGKWISAEGLEWKFREIDGPIGKPTSKAKLPKGTIAIHQVNSPELKTNGSLWRTTMLKLEGWFTMTNVIGDQNCYWNYKLTMKESPEGRKLTGTARLSGKQEKPCNIMSKEPWQIQLQRQ